MANIPDNSAGMSAVQARRIEFSIIGLCVGAMVLIFQPFSLTLFAIGCVLVVVGGLAFNLVPFCQPGKSVKSLIRVGVIVVIVFIVAVLLALGSTELYKLYLLASR